MVIFWDQTYSHMPPSAGEVFAAVGNIEYGTAIFTEITDGSMNREFMAPKTRSPPYWLQVMAFEEEKDQDYETKFIRGFDTICRPSEEHARSVVYGAIAPYLCRLANSDASIRRIIAFSDFTEHSQVSFYDYRGEDPVKRMGKDYDTIVRRLEKAHPHIRESPLDGIEIWAVHLPKRENDRLHEAVRLFWTRYFTGKGAVIRFVPSLNSALLVAENKSK